MKTARLTISLIISGAIVTLLFLSIFMRNEYFFGRPNPANEITQDRLFGPNGVYGSANLQHLEFTAQSDDAAAGGAARTLFSYYAMYHRPHTPQDDVAARKWLEIAARNDDPDSMLELATVVQHEGGTKNCAQAIALIRKLLTLPRNSKFIGETNDVLSTMRKAPDCRGVIQE